MTIQANVGAAIIAGAETSFGVEAASNLNTATGIRRVSTSLATVKGSFASNEARPDQQVADLRHGGIGVQGSIEAELSTVSHDPFIAAALRGVWAAGASSTQTAWTTPNIAFTVIGGGVYRATFGASGGSLITLGYRQGDIVKFSSLVGAASLNGKYLRIVAITATTMDFTVLDETVISASPTNAVWTLAVQGSKLVNGILKPSFTIEQSYDDIDVTELFSGMRVGGMNIAVPPNGNATASFAFQGRRGRILTGASAPYFTAAQAQGVTGILNGIGGNIRIAGTDQQVVTGFNLSANNNLNAPPVVGTPYVPDIFYGRHVLTGSVSAFLENESLIAAFLNESNIEVAVDVTGATPNADLLAFTMENVKFTGAQKQVGPEGGVIVQFPFQALLKSGTGYDTTTICIQRSNAS